MSRLLDIRILVLEKDIYARHAIVSYLSWDRHTRVVEHTGSQIQLMKVLQDDKFIDMIILDTTLTPTPHELRDLIGLIDVAVPGICIVCLSHLPDYTSFSTAYEAGARAFLTRDQVGIGIAHAVRHILEHDFTITRDMLPMLANDRAQGRMHTSVLPRRRHYPRLTQRIEQAIWLCVVEGLPAELAAEEMGVSVSTVRSYIKEGYRILEASDNTAFPTTISPVERAYRRFTALDDEIDEPLHRWQPAA